MQIQQPIPVLSLGKVFDVTITGNTIINPPDAYLFQTETRSLIYRLRQGGTGGHTVTLGSGFRLPSSVSTITPSTAANTTDILSAMYNPQDNKWDVFAFIYGYNN
jgi:hypothetical protein